MTLALIEYAEGLDLPEQIFSSPELTKLRETALDLMIWMHVRAVRRLYYPKGINTRIQDIASYNVQQASGHAYNAVAVLMTSQHISLQAGMHRAGDRIKALVVDFLTHEAALAQSDWGPYVDRDVRVCVVGLRDCVVGTAHWVYQCDRYFQGKGEDVKAFGWVFLLLKAGGEGEGEGDP